MWQFSVPQIEYSLGGSSKNGSHVYFLLHVFWVILLFCQIVLLFDINVVLMLPRWPDVTIVQSDVTIVVSWQLSTGSIHDYLFCYSPLVGILFKVLRIICFLIQRTLKVHITMVRIRIPQYMSCEFPVPQIEYPLGGSSKKGSHVYFLLIVAMILLLWCQILLLWRQDNIYIKQ